MIVVPETFYNVLLSPRDLQAAKKDISKLNALAHDHADEEHELPFKWGDYPALDKITDAILACQGSAEVVS